MRNHSGRRSECKQCENTRKKKGRLVSTTNKLQAIKEIVANTPIPFKPTDFVKWDETRVYEVTELSLELEYSTEPIDRARLGVWCEREVRVAHMDTEEQVAPNDAPTYPFRTYVIHFRPEVTKQALALLAKG